MQKPFSIVILFIFLLLKISFASTDSLLFFFQRTIYLENLLNKDGLWANPAIIEQINYPTTSFCNVTPLSYRYTLANAKYLFPISNIIKAGIGIRGTGINTKQSTSISENSIFYQSNFRFSNPSLQTAIALNVFNIQKLGLLIDAGFESLPDGYGNYSLFPLINTAIGILTPYYFNYISLSFVIINTLHFWNKIYSENNGKAGVIFKINDDLINMCFEYAFSIHSAIVESFYYSSSLRYYEVFKYTTSFKICKSFGIILGYSTDIGEFSDIGDCIHAGLELKQSNNYNFFGGYEIGVSTFHRSLIIHRVWLGYQFNKKSVS
jgi:hypothetical protein